MPFPLKIQPIDGEGAAIPSEISKPAPAKFRLKKLFDWQFSAALRCPSVDKPAGDGKEKDPSSDFEPSSLCLAGMVQNFMESGPNERPPPPPRCGGRLCFHANGDDISDDDLDFADGLPTSSPPSTGDPIDLLKNLVLCASISEKNLLSEISKILDKNANNKKGNRCSDFAKIVVESLTDLGFKSSICLSRWEKSSSFPAGEYQYIDAIFSAGERLIVDLDFRSEFEIARSTKSYRAKLQILPAIFVGREDRLSEIISLMSEAALQSMKKKGLHIPPWRRPEYLRAKWLSPFTRTFPIPPSIDSGELELRSEESGQPAPHPEPSPTKSPSSSPASARSPAT